MKNKKRIPKASLALILSAFVLLAAGGAIATFAAPDIISEDYKAEFTLDDIDVCLVENGVSSDKIKPAALMNDLGGSADPGRIYQEELAAKNNGDVGEYVRMYVRVYWLDKNGKKDASVDPSLIELKYNDKDYNDSAWQINPDETTPECRVFYYSKALDGGETTEPVVNKLSLSGKVLDYMNVTQETVGKKTVYTYTYKYDGYSIAVEADCQSLQMHNVNDAIKSVWGVNNVTVSGTTLSVK
jgi:hypothetical protein